jgi:hypothetical protein
VSGDQSSIEPAAVEEKTTASGVLDNVKGISQKKAKNAERAKDRAVDALDSATKAGFQGNIEVYIDAPDVSKSDGPGLSKIQNTLGAGVVSEVVIFTGDGTVDYKPTSDQQKQIDCSGAGRVNRSRCRREGACVPALPGDAVS